MGQELVLSLKMFLDFDRLMQDCLSILVGVVGTLVRCDTGDLLAYNDDRQENQLQKRLGDPSNQGRGSAFPRF